MSRYLPPEASVPDLAVAAATATPRAVIGRGPWLFLGMGLAGILTVALIVTADQSIAGIDPMRAVRALVPQNETDQPAAAQPPFLGGLIAVIHDVAPSFLAPTASTPPVSPAEASSPPANSPPPGPQPTAAPVPAAQLPVSTTPPPSVTPTPTVVPTPSPSPSPTVSPTPAPSGPAATPGPTAPPSATPVPTPTPVLSITTDRGSAAIVNLTALVPGDSMDRTITVQNGGNVAFRYTVRATQTASTLLWTDVTDGLQLVVRTSGGTTLYSGPISGVGTLAGPTTLAPGTTELLRYTFYFPANASNAFQGLVQDLTLVFDAVEYP